MMRVAGLIVPMFLVVGLVGAAGCGGGADGFSGQRGTVSGSVTLDGKPLQQGCSVLFMSASGTYVGTGVVNDAGSYTIAYRVPAGLPIGEYRIQISPPAEAASAPVDPAAMASQMKLSARGSGSSDGPVPSKYQSVASSGLSFTVAAGANTAPLELVTK